MLLQTQSRSEHHAAGGEVAVKCVEQIWFRIRHHSLAAIALVPQQFERVAEGRRAIGALQAELG